MDKLTLQLKDNQGNLYTFTDNMVENRFEYARFCEKNNITLREALAHLCWAQGNDFVQDEEELICLTKLLGLKPVRRIPRREKIKKMNDEQFTEWLFSLTIDQGYCSVCPIARELGYDDRNERCPSNYSNEECKKEVIKYLEQEVVDD